MVRRDEDRVLPVDCQVEELVSSGPNIATLLAHLVSPSSKLLEKENIDLLFAL